MSSDSDLRYDSKRPESWPKFVRRLKLIISVKATKEEIKRGMLLSALDDQTLDRLEQWVHPRSLESCSYSTLLAELDKNIVTAVNRTVQYVSFTTRRQQPGESAAAFMDALTLAGPTVGWTGEVLDDMCMHQFVAGLEDVGLQDKLFETAGLTREKALQLAVQTEATRAHKEAVRAGAGADHVHAVGGQGGKKKVVCYRCGEGHYARECPYDRNSLKCSKCQGVGHVTSVCGLGKPKGGKPKPKRKPTGTPTAAPPSPPGPRQAQPNQRVY
ncbi:hypothetical protein ONE63_004477 [Megalurothrips usitatus]|uniref:CCHC-type domain-containing protein n=1 Tax=Megalurothrips usitatus TaxID=439358 RepID=A0AAV7X9U8_9NEOP|nr:hypothetical protein ONE63_004477 [Megalurothrips usitatus]